MFSMLQFKHSPLQNLNVRRRRCSSVVASIGGLVQAWPPLRGPETLITNRKYLQIVLLPKLRFSYSTLRVTTLLPENPLVQKKISSANGLKWQEKWTP